LYDNCYSFISQEKKLAKDAFKAFTEAQKALKAVN
jgi:hypothetical protein